MCLHLNVRCSLQAEQLHLPFVEDRRPPPGHIFVIVDRGEPMGDAEFCSALCTEAYVKCMPGNWEIKAEYFSHRPSRNVTMHYIEICKRQEGLKIPRESREAGAT